MYIRIHYAEGVSRTWDGERLINIEVSLSTTRPFGSTYAQITEDGSRVWLVVQLSDSGPGIPLDDQARLFTRFNDVNSGNGVRRSSSLGGTGLGACQRTVVSFRSLT